MHWYIGEANLQVPPFFKKQIAICAQASAPLASTRITISKQPRTTLYQSYIPPARAARCNVRSFRGEREREKAYP